MFVLIFAKNEAANARNFVGKSKKQKKAILPKQHYITKIFYYEKIINVSTTAAVYRCGAAMYGLLERERAENNC